MKRWLTESHIDEKEREIKRFLLTIERHKRIWRQMKNVLIGWNVILSHTHIIYYWIHLMTHLKQRQQNI